MVGIKLEKLSNSPSLGEEAGTVMIKNSTKGCETGNERDFLVQQANN